MKSLLALSLLLSSYAFAGCDLIEDPPISEVNCNDVRMMVPTGSEWTRLSHNATTNGLKNNGGLSAQVAVELSGSDALVGKIQATNPILDKSSVSAGTDESAWIDLVVHRASNGSSVLELIAYRYVAGQLQIENSVTTNASLSNSASLGFGVSYTYSANAVTVTIKAANSGTVLSAMTMNNFGQTLPAIKLRRGVQPSASNVLTASFVQNGYWSY
jgi:hypothetical protein